MHWIREATGALDAAGERAGEDRLRRAGDVLEQDMALAGERREHESDLIGLADHDRLDVRAQPRGDVVSLLEALVHRRIVRGW